MRNWFFANDNFGLYFQAINGFFALIFLFFPLHSMAIPNRCEGWLTEQQARLANNIYHGDLWEKLGLLWEIDSQFEHFGETARGSLGDKVRALTLDMINQKIRKMGSRSKIGAMMAFNPPGEDLEKEEALKSDAEKEFDKLWSELYDSDGRLKNPLQDEPAELSPRLQQALEKGLKEFHEIITTSWLYSSPEKEDLNFQCPSYHTVRNLVHFHIEADHTRTWSIAESFAYIHEMEHAMSTHQKVWNSERIPHFAKRLRHKLEVFRVQLERDLAEYWRESSSSVLRTIAGYLISKQEIPAIGAQWELAMRIPEELRSEMISMLEKERSAISQGDSRYAKGSESAEKQLRLKTAVQIRTIAIESLKRADLHKDDFILQMLPVHHYGVNDFLRNR